VSGWEDTHPHDGERLIGTFQQALLALAMASAVFVAAELASVRHWNETAQVVPFVVVAIVLVSGAILALARGRFSVWQARLAALVAASAALFGLYEHVVANLDTGVLNSRYDWETLSGWEHAWLAASGAVGGSPALAPLALGLAGALLGLATLGRA
jgi:hypothetical protein